MKASRLLCFIFGVLSLVGCKADRDSSNGGKRIYDITALKGDVLRVDTFCGGLLGCAVHYTNVTLEIGVGGGCDDFLGVDYTVDKDSRTVHIKAQALSDVTPGTMCTLEYKFIHTTLDLGELEPPFSIWYDGTDWVTHVNEDGTWSNGQWVE